MCVHLTDMFRGTRHVNPLNIRDSCQFPRFHFLYPPGDKFLLERQNRSRQIPLGFLGQERDSRRCFWTLTQPSAENLLCLKTYGVPDTSHGCWSLRLQKQNVFWKLQRSTPILWIAFLSFFVNNGNTLNVNSNRLIQTKNITIFHVLEKLVHLEQYR